MRANSRELPDFAPPRRGSYDQLMAGVPHTESAGLTYAAPTAREQWNQSLKTRLACTVSPRVGVVESILQIRNIHGIAGTIHLVSTDRGIF
jgi:hypothetical protein